MENTKPASLVIPEASSAEPSDSPAQPPAKSRSLALVILATIALVYVLDWAQVFFVSLLVGILIAYTLNPLVAWLQRIGIHRVIGTTVVMLGVLSALVFGAYALRGQVQTIVNQLPSASSKLSAAIATLRQSQRRTMQKMENAARALENATSPAAAPKPADTDVPQVQVVIEPPPRFKLDNFLLTSSMGVLTVESLHPLAELLGE